MGIEVLKAFRNLRTAIQGEKGDVVRSRRPIGIPSEDHQELFLPGSHGESSKCQEKMQEYRGHFDLEGNCMKIGLPGKLILTKRKGLREVLFS